MPKKTISADIKEEVQQIVDRYNKKNKAQYQVSFRGLYCYLSRLDDKTAETSAFSHIAKMIGLPEKVINTNPIKETKIGRLEWTGKMDSWHFTVFRYSNESYDEEASYFMPGTELLDGTIEGAMKAGWEIYP